MIFQEPTVEFIQLIPTDISTISGAGYRVCQFTGYATVTCEDLHNDVSKSTLCGRSCVTSSDAANEDDYNLIEECDEIFGGPSYGSD